MDKLTNEEIDQRHAWMAIALRTQSNLDDVLDRVCEQAREANELRIAFAEALDAWEFERRRWLEDDFPGDEKLARIAELRTKFIKP
jgi:hypothetical protein